MIVYWKERYIAKVHNKSEPVHMERMWLRVGWALLFAELTLPDTPADSEISLYTYNSCTFFH